MNYNFNIYPNITITKTIVRAEVTITQLILFDSARIAVVLYDEQNVVQKVHQLILNKENGYDNWVSDKWLLDFVKREINII